VFNGTTVTVRGNVATEPVHRQTESGTTLCSFRVAATARRYSLAERRTVDVDTSFFTVTCWRNLADNAFSSLTKGDGVVVCGRLRIREFVHDGQARTSADIVAETVGHDLAWGTSRFHRVLRVDRADPDEQEAEALADTVTVRATEGGGAVTGEPEGGEGPPLVSPRRDPDEVVSAAFVADVASGPAVDLGRDPKVAGGSDGDSDDHGNPTASELAASGVAASGTEDALIAPVGEGRGQSSRQRRAQGVGTR
jgi:single-strand DNA-binding protein